MLVKVAGGYKIKIHKTGKLYPKVYASAEEAQGRIDQMERFSKGIYELTTIDDLYKARTPGAKDKKPRKRRVLKDTDPFKLYDSKDKMKATVEIFNALKTKDMDKIARAVSKWKRLGADDTTSRMAIVEKFGKMGGNKKVLWEKL